ncbi:MAG: protein-L-isoaspartate O-methyltransferase [Pseudomonadota bacterium]
MDFAAARAAMVDSQVRPNDVTKYSIIDALQRIKREDFVPDHLRTVAYSDMPLRIAEGRELLDPRVFSKLLDALNIKPTEFVLDIGCGLGYSSAVISCLAEGVVGVEEDPTLANYANDNLTAAEIDNAFVVEGAFATGVAKHGPYDVMIVEGGIEDFPAKLADQLKTGGRIGLIKIENGTGSAQVGIKTETGISWRDEFDAEALVLNGFEKVEGFTFG